MTERTLWDIVNRLLDQHNELDTREGKELLAFAHDWSQFPTLSVLNLNILPTGMTRTDKNALILLLETRVGNFTYTVEKAVAAFRRMPAPGIYGDDIAESIGHLQAMAQRMQPLTIDQIGILYSILSILKNDLLKDIENYEIRVEKGKRCPNGLICYTINARHYAEEDTATNHILTYTP